MDKETPLFVKIVGAIFFSGPLIFAFGFIAPLVSQIFKHTSLTPPFDLSGLAIGLIIAAVWGGFAQWKGRWI